MSLRTCRLLVTLGLIGTSAFLYGILFGNALRAWQTLLVNFLFFGGLAQAGIVLSALFQTTSASWARSLKRAAEALSRYSYMGAMGRPAQLQRHVA